MGIFAYLTKPVFQEDLADTIRKALDLGRKKRSDPATSKQKNDEKPAGFFI